MTPEKKKYVSHCVSKTGEKGALTSEEIFWKIFKNKDFSYEVFEKGQMVSLATTKLKMLVR